MLSKNQIKFIRSLEQKKFRKETGLFVAEGKKIVNEILHSELKIHSLFAISDFVPDWIGDQISSPTGSGIRFQISEVDEKELEKISFLTTPNEVLCIAEIPQYEINYKNISEKISIYLDGIRDPGNMGNIIRIADWFGISTVFCSPECADAYNPKVVQATMGSIARVKIYHANDKIIQTMRAYANYPIYATTLNGKNIYKEESPEMGLIVFGNESEGISKEILELSTHKISIPRFGKAESLNVASSAAIVCSEFMGRKQ